MEIRHFENSKRMELSKKEKSIGKGKGKEKRILENVHFQKLDTIEDPHNKHTIEDQGCSWGTPLKNCVSAVFCWVLTQASYNISVFCMFKNMLQVFMEKTKVKNKCWTKKIGLAKKNLT